jgi:hypothetical protein
MAISPLKSYMATKFGIPEIEPKEDSKRSASQSHGTELVVVLLVELVVVVCSVGTQMAGPPPSICKHVVPSGQISGLSVQSTGGGGGGGGGPGQGTDSTSG